MQTFLPYEDFDKSAKVLDKKRCWKQVVEVAQIIDVLEGRKTGWANHPAVKMWVGHTEALKYYFNCFLHVAVHEHGVNTKYEPFEIDGSILWDGQLEYMPGAWPWWLGKDKFHRAMRARLLEKDRDEYLIIFSEDEGYNNGKYWWPVMETKTFRRI